MNVPAPFCHMCGHQNPAGARFCSACGTALVATAAKPAPARTPSRKKTQAAGKRKSAAPPAAAQAAPVSAPPGKHIFVLIATAVLIVVALYQITSVSKIHFAAEPEAPVAETRSSSNGTDARQAPPLSGDLADQVAALEDELAGLTGAALQAKQDELAAVLAGAGRTDRVAELREAWAREANTPEAWKAAGDALYVYMESVQGEERMDIAQRTADAYDKALALGPDDLVARTAMAMAYMNTRAPMQGVMQIRQVLETDPNHLEGNFYYGVMLMQISRIDQAVAQFEKVKTLVGPEHPLYRQAEVMLANIRTLGRNGNS
ncbi:MAG: zinc-ribbon domain-containing protein [Rhodothermales bacterium]